MCMPLVRAIMPLRQECGQANEPDNSIPVSTLRCAAVCWHFTQQTADSSTYVRVSASLDAPWAGSSVAVACPNVLQDSN
jgi:hypothetical protein